MKKITSVFLTILVLLNYMLIIGVSADETDASDVTGTVQSTETAEETADEAAEEAEEFILPEKVEISFCVGDATLNINGSDVTVEKPYVVGDGTTLVPVRVITEAFGAKVGWDAPTRTVTITYPDITIVLQIDNTVAEVNGMAVTLLAAPELTSNGFTMVPLRFISETFDAVVDYDPETRGITVVKENAQMGEMVEGAVDSAYIGDSYYAWTMENSADMVLDFRSFDGTYTMFTLGNNSIVVSLSPTENDYNFERDFIEWKNSFAGYTLTKADKDTTDPNLKWMHFQAKDKTTFYDYWVYVNDGYIFVVSGYLDNADTESRDECIRLLETFKCSYIDEDTYNLSNLKNGMRTFESEEFKYSLEIPEGFWQTTSEDVESRVNFARFKDNNNETINVAIYSKSEFGSAKDMAVLYHDFNKLTMNENITVVGDVVENTYGELTVYEYEFSSTAYCENVKGKDICFEIGEYVYDLHIMLTPNEGYEDMLKRIVESFKAEELDPTVTGVIMNDMPEMEGTYVIKDGTWSVDVPNNFVEVAKNAMSLSLFGMIGGTSVNMGFSSVSGVTSADVEDLVKQSEMSIEDTGAEVLDSRTVSLGDRAYDKITAVYEIEGQGRAYIYMYISYKSNKLVTVSAAVPEGANSKFVVGQIEGIIDSLTIR